MSHPLSMTRRKPLGWRRHAASQGAAAPPAAAPKPWASLVLSSLAAALYLSPDWSARLSYDRGALAAGELWRLVTAHWTHWSADHLGWNLLVFTLLGIVWERLGRRPSFLVFTLSSALLISAAVWLFQPGMAFYRGLSGIDCALVTATAAALLRRSLAAGRRRLSWALAAVLAGTFLKVLYELTTGSTVFVSAASAPFSAVPLAHLVGGVYGLVLGGRQRHRRSRSSGSSHPAPAAVVLP